MVTLLLILFLIPASIDAVKYKAPTPNKLAGVLTPNKKLLSAQLLAVGKFNGPESIAIDKNHRICSGTQDGDIKCIMPNQEIKTITNTGGRPLGMKFDNENNLIVCDAYKGLLSFDENNKITVLANSAQGIAFKFTDDLDIASNGIIYFTDASSKYKQSEYLYDLLEAQPHGRFMSYNPQTKMVKVLLDNLYFANGVALSENEDFVLVNETYRYRIMKYWLKGVKKGTSEIFVDNLPGFPDNITSNGNGTFWLALFTVRNEKIDRYHSSPFVKSLISKLPKIFWPKPQPYGFVVSLNEKGKFTQSLHDTTGKHLKEITSALESKCYLYIGSLHNDRIGKYKLKSASIN